MTFKQIPIAATIDGGPHDRFPVYLQPSAISGWQALTQAEADSTRIYQDADKVVEWPREVVDSDEIHYRHDGLDTGQSMYVDYDGVRADYAPGDANGRNAVWVNGFEAVWHMGQAPAMDSTGHGYSASGPNTTSGDVVSAKIGDGIDFNGADDYLQFDGLGNQPSCTLSVWANFEDVTKDHELIYWGDGGDQIEFSFKQSTGMRIFYWDGMRTYGLVSTGYTPPAGQPAYLIGSYDQSTGEWVYRQNMSLSITATDTATFTFTGTNNRIGKHPASGRYFNGIMSEVRIASVTRSLAWEQVEYTNQSDPATFFGTATDVGGTFVLSVEDSVLRQDVTQSVVTVACGVAEGLVQDDTLGSVSDIATIVVDTGNLTDSESALVHASAALVDGVNAGEQWAVQADARAAINAHTALSSQFVISAVQAGNISTADQRSVHDSVAVLLDTFMQIGSDRAVTDRASVATVLRAYRSDGRTVSDQINNALNISVSVADHINRHSLVTFPNLTAQYSYVTIGALSVVAAVSADAGIIPKVSADIDIKPEN